MSSMDSYIRDQELIEKTKTNLEDLLSKKAFMLWELEKINKQIVKHLEFIDILELDDD